MKLLLRSYDVSDGSVAVDGTAVRDVTLRSLRLSIGYVSQEPFRSTVPSRENIAYGLDVTNDEIQSATE